MLKTYESGNGDTITFDPRDVIGLQRTGVAISVTLTGYIILSLGTCEPTDLVDVYKSMVADWQKAKERL